MENNIEIYHALGKGSTRDGYIAIPSVTVQVPSHWFRLVSLLVDFIFGGQYVYHQLLTSRNSALFPHDVFTCFVVLSR
jgi:hypothetical protein